MDLFFKTFLDHFGTKIGSFWRDFGIYFGSMGRWHRFGVLLTYFAPLLGSIFDPICGHFGTILGPEQDRFGVILG